MKITFVWTKNRRYMSTWTDHFGVYVYAAEGRNPCLSVEGEKLEEEDIIRSEASHKTRGDFAADEDETPTESRFILTKHLFLYTAAIKYSFSSCSFLRFHFALCGRCRSSVRLMCVVVMGVRKRREGLGFDSQRRRNYSEPETPQAAAKEVEEKRRTRSSKSKRRASIEMTGELEEQLEKRENTLEKQDVQWLRHKYTMSLYHTRELFRGVYIHRRFLSWMSTVLWTVHTPPTCVSYPYRQDPAE